MFFFFWIPIIFICLTLFIFKQLDDGSGHYKLPIWFFFSFILYFIPVGNFLIFAFIISTIIDDNLQLRKGSILCKFKGVFMKLAKILNKEVDL